MVDQLAKLQSGGWAQGGIIRPGVTTDTVGLQATFPKAQTFTAQFSIEDRNTALLGEVVGAIATLKWSINGQHVRRQVSCANGMSISGVAETVSISITDASFINPANLAQYTGYHVSANVAPGTRPSQQQPPYLDTSGTLGLASNILVAGPSSINYPVPQDAGVISVFTAISTTNHVPAPDNSIVVVQTTTPGTRLKSYDPRQAEWVPIAPGCTNLLIEGGAAWLGSFVFPIFGIDG